MIGLTIPPNVLARADRGNQVKVRSKQKAAGSKQCAHAVALSFMCLLLAVFIPTGFLDAQQSKKILRIGFLSPF